MIMEGTDGGRTLRGAFTEFILVRSPTHSKPILEEPVGHGDFPLSGEGQRW